MLSQTLVVFHRECKSLTSSCLLYYLSRNILLLIKVTALNFFIEKFYFKYTSNRVKSCKLPILYLLEIFFTRTKNTKDILGCGKEHLLPFYSQANNAFLLWIELWFHHLHRFFPMNLL